MRALLWSLAPMPALVLAYVFAPPEVVGSVALASGVFVVYVVVRTGRLIRRQERENRRYASLVRHSSDVATVVDENGTIRFVSPAVERLLGLDPAALEGTSFAALVHPDQADAALGFAFGDSTEPVELALRRADGTWLDTETLRINLAGDPSVRGVVLTSRDITERKAFLTMLEQHAFYDSLTGLANRALFRDRVDHALVQARRAGATVAALFMDLDDFKIVNDTHGHATGDRLLTAVGARLQTCLRSGDTVARLGGDEFAILLEESTDVAPAEVGDRILRAFDAPFRLDGRELQVGASIGVAHAGGLDDDASADDLLRRADVAMYVAKNEGKGRCEVYRPADHERATGDGRFRAELERALDGGELVLYYQPLVALGSGRVSGLEALVRWQHPERGLLAAPEFVPLAEESGLIIPLGRWALREACGEARRLQDLYPSDPPLSMAVNVSARQLDSPTLVADVHEALAASGIDPSTLTLDVAESATARNVERAALRLRELRELGVRVAIDDFAAGHSSLGRLRELAADVLKVDRSFVDGVDRGEQELALVAAVLGIARALGLEPVAEGVERATQAERLAGLGCASAQGFHFGRPAPLDEVERLISAERPPNRSPARRG